MFNENIHNFLLFNNINNNDNNKNNKVKSFYLSKKFFLFKVSTNKHLVCAYSCPPLEYTCRDKKKIRFLLLLYVCVKLLCSLAF